MPNGGITPDCVHCKLYKGEPRTEGHPFCNHHQIDLPSPIRAFCSDYVDPEPQNDIDWLDQELKRAELDKDMMYLWLGGYEKPFFHVPLVTIDEYKLWTRDKFLEAIASLSDEYNND